jgi:hypothetical protein
MFPYDLVGKHRRVRLRDVLAYSEGRSAARKAALNRMTRDGYEAGLCDDGAIGDGGEDEL